MTFEQKDFNDHAHDFVGGIINPLGKMLDGKLDAGDLAWISSGKRRRRAEEEPVTKVDPIRAKQDEDNAKIQLAIMAMLAVEYALYETIGPWSLIGINAVAIGSLYGLYRLVYGSGNENHLDSDEGLLDVDGSTMVEVVRFDEYDNQSQIEIVKF